MIAFRFDNLIHEPCSATGEGFLLLDAQADVALVVDATRVFVIEAVPVLELAQQLDEWRAGLMTGDFEYTSMDDVARGIVWIRREGAGWRIGSVWADACSSPRSTEEIAECIGAYVAQVRAIDVSRIPQRVR